MNIQKCTFASPACWLPADDEGPLFSLKSLMPGPRQPQKPRQQRLQSIKARSSEQCSRGRIHTTTQGVVNPSTAAASPGCLPLAVSRPCRFHGPGCVPTSLLFQHPDPGPKWGPSACPSQSEASRACGKQVVLRGRRPQSTLTSNTG